MLAWWTPGACTVSLYSPVKKPAARAASTVSLSPASTPRTIGFWFATGAASGAQLASEGTVSGLL